VGQDITIEDDKVHVVPSVATGPLGHGLSALLVGRSSASSQGIFVLPGIIDTDFTGPIGIMLQVFTPRLTIKRGSKVAQLIPFIAQVPPADPNYRGSDTFGSSGPPLVAFVQPLSTEQPIRKITIKGPNGIVLKDQKMLLDSRAEVTIIPRAQWPESWPLTVVLGMVTGIGGAAVTQMSTEFITFVDQDDKLLAQARPYVLNTTIWLLDRDVLSQSGCVIQTPFSQRPLKRAHPGLH